MTDIVRYEDARPPRDWVGLFPAAAQLAEAVAKTDFVPQALRNNVPAITAAILYGDEVGLGPMQSLSKVAVINGKPSLAAEAQRALVLAHGHLIWLEEATITSVTWAAARRESPDRVTRITWTMDDANRAGLGGQQNYRKYPRAMLSARASAELIRDVFADVIGGLAAIEEADGYDVEAPPEAGAPDALPPAPEAKPPARRRRTKRAPAPPPVAQVTDQTPPERELPALPGEERDEGPAMPFPNWYAMRLNELGAGGARHDLTRALSNGRTESSSELNGEETARAREVIAEGLEAVTRTIREAVQEEGPESAPTSAAQADPEDAPPPTPDPAPEPVEAAQEPEDAEVIISSAEELRDLMKAHGARVSDVIRKAAEGIDPKFAPKSLDDIVRNGDVLVKIVEWLEGLES